MSTKVCVVTSKENGFLRVVEGTEYAVVVKLGIDNNLTRNEVYDRFTITPSSLDLSNTCNSHLNFYVSEDNYVCMVRDDDHYRELERKNVEIESFDIKFPNVSIFDRYEQVVGYIHKFAELHCIHSIDNYHIARQNDGSLLLTVDGGNVGFSEVVPADFFDKFDHYYNERRIFDGVD